LTGGGRRTYGRDRSRRLAPRPFFVLPVRATRRMSGAMARSVGRLRARTLEEVADLAGVSKSTVSRVVNGSQAVSPAARDLVRAVIARTGYRPNHAARSLVTRRTGSIGLVVSEPEGRVFSDPFFASMVRGVTAVARERDVQLVLVLADDERAQQQVLDYLRDGHLDGALLFSSHEGDPLPRRLVEERLPATMCGRPVRPIAISFVDVDNAAGAQLAVDHLIDRGRRRIATVAGPHDMPAGQDRLSGYRRTLLRHRLPASARLVARGNFTRSGGAAAMEQILSRTPPPDGLFAANDLMALGALAVLAERGLRVPQDVAVVGFDDSLAALEARPPLTTVHQPVEAMARSLAVTLLDRIADPDHPITTQVFPPRLVIRESS
jgi:DNA-binding LacI/PurR family transcriptional regulator